MQLNQLEAFVAVVDCGTVTEAAQRLHIAQPALSRSIRKLEHELGHRLFDHQGRRLCLTPFGHRAYDKARHILEEARMMTQGDNTSRLYLGASLTTLTTFLPEAIRIFREVSPATELHVDTGLSADVFDQVGTGRVEIGLVSDAQARPYFRVIPLFTDPLWVLYPPNSPWARADAIAIEQLNGEPLILMTPRTILRIDLDALFHACAVVPDIRMEVDNVDIIQRMVSVGLGATILPRSVCLAASHERGWHAAPLLNPSVADPSSRLTRTFGLITLHTDPSPLAQIWIDVCMNLAERFQNAEVYRPTLGIAQNQRPVEV